MKNKLFSEIQVSLETALELGLTENEYNSIIEKIGRIPTYTELGVYSVMWSEHCSYKNSILQLKTLPRTGSRLLVEAGEENAGLVDIGNGYAICFKIESHNHPSAIEPFQGAATGVGGILRDIFTMGARPIAALNSLRFGELNNDRTKFLLRGVVEGIAHYGNCFGVPTVGGEIYFDDCYNDNPLVNAMAAGIVAVNKTASAAATGIDNPVFIIGSSTGRDGIHGASLLASREFDEKTENMRPTVQVGDPFSEKLLLEATIELIDNNTIAGIQDMGAAGISCSTSEMSGRTGVGMDINLDLVPQREPGMSAYEIMLSESQERMLAVIHQDKIEKAKEICDKWDVPFTQIGKVTDSGILQIYSNGNLVCELDANNLVLGGGAPRYIRETKRPDYLKETESFNTEKIANSIPTQESFWEVLASPTIASKRWIYEQYDSQVRTNTVAQKGDAAVIRIKEIPGKAIALTTDCNSRYTYLNPYMGAAIAVSEAARNVACVGAKPVAITNCLNFGNPYDPEVYWQFAEAIRGMGDACREFETPVTGGNVSFHNESKHFAVFPTPTIGMLGIMDDVNKVMSSNFKNVGDIIIVLGIDNGEIGGSEYLKLESGKITGKSPIIDLKFEKNLIDCILNLINDSIINSAHDISEGGLAICLAEKSISSNKIGCNVKLDLLDAASLFGESQSRIVITVSNEKLNDLYSICDKYAIPYCQIGETIENEFIIKSFISTNYDELKLKYETAISNIMES
ncbi:MAG TPA: phosphoribosylformylglycinamidine synthase subunit PurL [Candidatus Kapabacteria bacterium]|nr:phosphoribosylformylglycinamidine synthase subunit PurL [Candidatus Kapabacteria bacterium]